MPESTSALGRLNNNRPRINEEAERGLLGGSATAVEEAPVHEPEPALAPVAVTQVRPRRAGKQSAFEELTAAAERGEHVVPFSVRLPVWLRDLVRERVKTAQGKGIKLTQDMVVKQALLDLFGVQEPE